MKANKALYVIVFVVIAAVVGMAWFLFSGSAIQASKPAERDVLNIAINDLTPEEIRAMGIEGDTPQDTLRTLVATSKSNQKKFDQTFNELDRLKRENVRLNKKEEDINYQIGEAVRSETQPLLAEIADLKRQLFEAVEKSSGNVQPLDSQGTPQGFGAANSNNELPVNGNYPNANAISLDPAIKWVEPSDQIGLDASGKAVSDSTKATSFGFPSVMKLDASATQKKGLPFIGDSDEAGSTNTSTRNSKVQTKTPVYTLPENATLLGSVAMTALIGRVPVGNNISDPYPFKIVIGRENLIANGIELPNVEGAIVSGSATGDWTLSCVRGTVKSFTFVFSDGRIVSSSQSGSKNSDGIGWISDEHGIPCVPGERKTNAPEYLGTNFLLAGASAAAQGFSQSQTTTVVDGSSVVGAVTGDQGKFILGQALGSGLKETAEWFRQRYGEMFDAVYVPPGRSVAIHLEKDISIDYDTQGRKVKYRLSQKSPNLD